MSKLGNTDDLSNSETKSPPPDGGGAADKGGAFDPSNKDHVKDFGRVITKRIGSYDPSLNEVFEQLPLINLLPWGHRITSDPRYPQMVALLNEKYGGNMFREHWTNRMFQDLVVGLLLLPENMSIKVLDTNTADIARLGHDFLMKGLLGLPGNYPAIQRGYNFSTLLSRQFRDYLLEGTGPAHLHDRRLGSGFAPLIFGHTLPTKAPESTADYPATQEERVDPALGPPVRVGIEARPPRKKVIQTILDEFHYFLEEAKAGKVIDPSQAMIRDQKAYDKKHLPKGSPGTVEFKQKPGSKCRIATWNGPRFKIDFYPHGRLSRIPEKGMLPRVRWWILHPELSEKIPGPVAVEQVLTVFPELYENKHWNESVYQSLLPNFEERLKVIANSKPPTASEDADGWSPEMVDSFAGIPRHKEVVKAAASLLVQLANLNKADEEFEKAQQQRKELQKQKQLSQQQGPAPTETKPNQRKYVAQEDQHVAEQVSYEMSGIEPGPIDNPKIQYWHGQSPDGEDKPSFPFEALRPPPGFSGAMFAPIKAIPAFPTDGKRILYGHPARFALILDPQFAQRPLQKHPELHEEDDNGKLDQWGNLVTDSGKVILGAYVRAVSDLERPYLEKSFNVPMPVGWMVAVAPNTVNRIWNMNAEEVQGPYMSTEYYALYNPEDNLNYENTYYVSRVTDVLTGLSSVPYQSFAQLQKVPNGQGFTINLNMPSRINPDLHCAIALPHQSDPPQLNRNMFHPDDSSVTSADIGQASTIGFASANHPVHTSWYHLSKKWLTARGYLSTDNPISSAVHTLERVPDPANSKFPDWCNPDDVLSTIATAPRSSWDSLQTAFVHINQFAPEQVDILKVTDRCSAPFRLSGNHVTYQSNPPTTRAIKFEMCYPCYNQGETESYGRAFPIEPAQTKEPHMVLSYEVKGETGAMFSFGDDVERPPSESNPYNVNLIFTYNMVDPFSPVGFGEFLNTIQPKYKPQIDTDLVYALANETSAATFNAYINFAGAYWYSYGSSIGQAFRFAGCLYNGSLVSGFMEYVSPFQPTSKILGQAFTVEHWVLYLNSQAIPRQPNNSNLGPTLPNLLRTPATIPLERAVCARWIKELFSCHLEVSDDSEDREEELLRMLYTFQAKPKLEMNPKNKFWTKSRSIFACNAFAMQIFQAMQNGIKAEFDPSSTILLGCDPPSAFWLIWKVDAWRVYSDNVYHFGPNSWSDYDGSSMESVIKKPVFECLNKTILEALSRTEINIAVEIAADDLADVKIAMLACVTEEDNYKYFSLVTAPVYPSTDFFEGRTFQLPRELPELLALLSGVIFVDFEVYQQVITITLEDPTTDPDNFAQYYLAAFAAIPDKAVGINSSATFRIPFMPSGIPCTALLNSIVSFNSLLRLRISKVQPLHPINKSPDPKFEFRTVDEYQHMIRNRQFARSLEDGSRGLGAVMTIEGEGNWNEPSTHDDPKSPDFLGMIHYTEPFSHLELRKSTLLTSLYFEDPAQAGESFESITMRRISGLLAWILNGGIFWEDLYLAVCRRLTDLNYLAYADIILADFDSIVGESIADSIPPGVEQEKDYILRATQQAYFRLTDPTERDRQMTFLLRLIDNARRVLGVRSELIEALEQLKAQPNGPTLQAILSQHPNYRNSIETLIQHSTDPALKMLLPMLPDSEYRAGRGRVPAKGFRKK